jgi:hypothetical protein
MKFDIGYTDKAITPWGGMVLLRGMLDKIGFQQVVLGSPDLPVPGSNRGYHAITILESFIVSIWCGANRFLHTEVTRHDLALKDIFDWRIVLGQDTFKRFFSKFNQGMNHRVSDYFFGWIFSQLQFDNFVLDCDSSVVTRYGDQQGAKKGYNPGKRGRKSHHPLIAFIADIKLVANLWLRSGDTASSDGFLAFLEDTLAKLKGKIVSLIRLDSGFCSKEIIDYLEENKMDYIISARFYEPAQKLLASDLCWLPLDDGIEIAETQYQGASWQHSRRMVVIRQRIKERPKTTGKQLKLFKDDAYYRQYRYTAYLTNVKLPATEVWRLYRARADAENQIKELKYDFGFDSFTLNDFYATEAALIFTMIAYNLMAIFRLFIIKSEVQNRLSTLRFKTFAIGAYFENVDGRVILRLALYPQRRRWFETLWSRTNQFKTPAIFSNV